MSDGSSVMEGMAGTLGGYGGRFPVTGEAGKGWQGAQNLGRDLVRRQSALRVTERARATSLSSAASALSSWRFSCIDKVAQGTWRAMRRNSVQNRQNSTICRRRRRRILPGDNLDDGR